MTASTAAFAASWKDSNCAVRADNHENKKTVKMKIMEVRVKSLHGIHLTRHHGVGFGQPHPNGTGLFFDGMKGSLRDPKTDLKPAILLSHLRITVLGHPPLSKETSGIIIVVGVTRIR